LPDRQYLHHPTSAVVGDAIVVGYPYSVLAWVAKKRSSWALPVDIQRVPSSSDAIQVGAEQVQALCEQRQALLEPGFPIIVGDGRYGNPRFLGLLKDQPCGVLVRLRRTGCSTASHLLTAVGGDPEHMESVSPSKSQTPGGSLRSGSNSRTPVGGRWS
jgi:hypothetical protein